jgi:hypothetical protein
MIYFRSEVFTKRFLTLVTTLFDSVLMKERGGHRSNVLACGLWEMSGG